MYFTQHSPNVLSICIYYLQVPVSTCGYLLGSVHNRLPGHLQVPDLWAWITHGKLSVQIQVWIFDLKIPAGQVQVDPWVNSWRALFGDHGRSHCLDVQVFRICTRDIKLHLSHSRWHLKWELLGWWQVSYIGNVSDSISLNNTPYLKLVRLFQQ